jgi:hypothetical protein
MASCLGKRKRVDDAFQVLEEACCICLDEMKLFETCSCPLCGVVIHSRCQMKWERSEKQLKIKYKNRFRARCFLCREPVSYVFRSL